MPSIGMTRTASKFVRVRVVIVARVSIDDWRAEYGTDDSASDIRDSVRASINDATRHIWPSATFGAMVRVNEAER